ncbi:MarR family transcriptional regulator [Methylocystis sp. B8]|uniref:MarR family winged helix-turn-helix transcriptional regulator n=1 Tax=Methylocystis sp. B8 TaxID=544938 RepID=UPI0010FCF8EF|nr:MarR family transcriptional regulator [Methylocystis sp. B8]TLG72817.1 MarR family transcriptional regulator [Methylocystis sp. B8]
MNDLSARKIAEPAAVVAWRRAAAEAAATTTSDEGALELVELFFFAYRDFVGDADRLLENYGFGRAHHRVLHFVSRRPGLAIAALLEILRITKQSLNRVLKQLLEAGFVEAREGVLDRRQRLLYPTPQGAKLARDLAALQTARFLKVMDELPPAARGAASEFLFAMIDSDERERVRAHLACAKAAGAAP